MTCISLKFNLLARYFLPLHKSLNLVSLLYCCTLNSFTLTNTMGHMYIHPFDFERGDFRLAIESARARRNAQSSAHGERDDIEMDDGRPGPFRGGSRSLHLMHRGSQPSGSLNDPPPRIFDPNIKFSALPSRWTYSRLDTIRPAFDPWHILELLYSWGDSELESSTDKRCIDRRYQWSHHQPRLCGPSQDFVRIPQDSQSNAIYRNR